MVLKFFPSQAWPTYAGSNWMQFLKTAMEHFQGSNPGIRVQVKSPLPGNSGKYVQDIIAGDGPDVFEDYTPAPYLEGGLVMDLSAYMQRDNVDPSIWSPGEMHGLGAAGGVYFLPNGIHVNAMAINLSTLDELGLAYPDPDWGYEEATQLFQAATYDKGGTHHFGLHLQFGGNSLGTNVYILHDFGGALMDASGTRCILDSPGAIKAVQWADQLYWNNVAGGPLDLETVPFVEVGTNSMPQNLGAWANKFKWTYFPVPKFPAGQFSFEAVQFYAVNIATKHPDEAWMLERFVTSEPWFAQFEIKYLLRMPSLVSLLPEFVRTVEAVAPPAQGKNLDYFVTAADKWGVAPRSFRYAYLDALNLVNAAFADAFEHRSDVTAALTQATQQVNALEAEAASEAPGATGAALIKRSAQARARLESMFAAGSATGS